MAFMKRSVIALALLAGCVAAIPACSSSGDATSTPGGAAGETGLVGLNLVVGGETINTVSMTITSPVLASPINRTIDVSAPNATISAFAGALLPGTYQVAFAATTLSGETCSGAGTFTVTAGTTQSVTVPIVCGSADPAPDRGNANINGTVTVVQDCPYLTQVVVAPLQTDVGSSIDVSVATSGAGTVTWSATAGTFGDPAALTTTYTCTASGTQTITATLTLAGTACADPISAEVNCVGPAGGAGGASGAGGETGTGGAAAGGDTGAGGAGAGGDTSSGGSAAGGDTSSGGSAAGGDTSSGGSGAGGAAPVGANTSSGNAVCDDCQNTFCTAALGFMATECVGADMAGCDAVTSCINSSGCDQLDIDPFTGEIGLDIRSCYCGGPGRDFGLCFASTSAADPNYPNGACRTQIETLAGSTTPSAVGSQIFDSNFPLGAIGQLITCRNLACVAPQRENFEAPLCID